MPHVYSGQMVSRDIATFVEDILRPPGIITHVCFKFIIRIFQYLFNLI